MVANGDYSQKPEVITSTVYTGPNPKHTHRVLRKGLRNDGITSEDCRIRSYENGKEGSVQVKVKKSYKSEVFRIIKETIMGKIHPKSKRPTKLRSEVKGSLFLYRCYS